MKMGEKIWYCIRKEISNAEVEEYEAPVEEILRLPNVFSPISITVQPRNGFTDRLAYGETTTKDQRIILSPYEFWHKKFKEGDIFYLDGQMPSEDEEYFGQDANYFVESVNNQNEGIELLVKKIINK